MTRHSVPARLEHSSRPVAMVRDGVVIWANRAFLDRLGHADPAELVGRPLLDLVAEVDHEALRRHLEAAGRAAGTDRRHPRANLILRRANDLPLNAVLTSWRTRFDGQDCIQITLSDPRQEGLLGELARLPWRRWLAVLFLVLFTVLPSTLLLKLNIDNSPTVYFPDQEPAVAIDRKVREFFPNDQVYVLLFEGVALFSDGFLKAYDAVSRDLQKQEMVNEVLSLTLQDHIRGTADEFIVEPLIDVRRLDDSRPAERRRRVLSDRFARRALVSESGDAVALVVIPAKTGNSLERLALQEQILATVERHRLRGYLTAVAGEIPVDVAQLQSMLRDNMIFIPTTVFVELLLVWWLFRRWLAVVLAGVTIGVVVNSTMALYVLFHQPFTLVTTIIPPLLSALTVAALVHLYNALLLQSRLGFQGEPRVRRAVAEVSRPALYAAVTTAAGLASLATSEIIPIRMLGLVAAVGVMLAYGVIFHVLPELLVRWDKRPWPQVGGGARLVDGLVRLLYRTGLRHPLLVVAVIGGALIAAAPQLGKVVVETNLQEFFEPDHPIRQATRRIDEKLVGTMPLTLFVEGAGRDVLKDPRRLALLRDFQRWAERQPEVDRTLSAVDFLEEMNWAFHAEDPAYRRLPESAALVSQYLFIYDGDDLYDVVDRDFRHAQVTMNLNVHRANAIADFIERARAWLAQRQGGDLKWEIAGLGRLFADMEDLLVAGQVWSLVGALALIFLLMALLFRSVGAALLGMIPNLSPILVIFTLMGAVGIWLDMATAMIASIAVGVAVDDTIHVMDGFRRRVQRGVPPVLALVRTYHGAGRAVITTTVILCVQFLVLTSSDFVPTRSFGLLTAIGLLAALVFDLLLLPSLLILLYGPRGLTARWRAWRGGAQPPVAASSEARALDLSYWTPKRRVALVRELLEGRRSVAEAAAAYHLPEEVVARWLRLGERALEEAMDDDFQRKRRNMRRLVRRYRQLKAENQQLRALQQQRGTWERGGT
ncbi:MAG TPA: PAS domain-containing protein [Gammaproteobacteria bacterium]|nr:PAS domain-containing protein [Gammaproteobacteria bacterium]